MLHTVQARIMARLNATPLQDDRGVTTLEYMLWSAGMIAVIAALVALMKGSFEDFWNGLDFGSVTP